MKARFATDAQRDEVLKIYRDGIVSLRQKDERVLKGRLRTEKDA